MNNELNVLTDAELDLVAGGKGTNSNALNDFYDTLHAVGTVAKVVSVAEKGVNLITNVINSIL